MTTSTMGNPQTRLFAAGAGVVLTLGIVLASLIGQGHAAFNSSSTGLMWGLPIVTYDFFLLTSTGIAGVASLALVFGVRDFFAVAKRCIWLALSGLIGGVMVLALELGYPLRALYAIPFSFQVSSPLFWKVLFVAAYTALLLAVFVRLNRPGWDRGSARGVSILLFAALLGVTLLAGSVYGLMSMRPFWYGGEVPVAFLIESAVGGFAFTTFFTYMAYGFRQQAMPAKVRALFTGPLPLMHAAVLGLHIMFVGGRAIAGMWSNADGLEVWNHLARSPLFHFEIWLGLALPLYLLLAPAQRTRGHVQIAASALVMAALFIARYDYIVGGQMVPLLKGSWVHGLIVYVPSFTEWMLLLAAIFLANAVYAFGDRRFNLGAQPADRG